MVDDAEAREVVRQLMKRLDFIAARGERGGLGPRETIPPTNMPDYWKPPESLCRLRFSQSGTPTRNPTQSMLLWMTPHADWSKAVVTMLNRGPIELRANKRSNSSSSCKASKDDLKRK